MSRQKEYYVFARPNSMVGHKFTDDVALCKAVSKSQAIKIFSKYYANVNGDEVFRLTTKDYKPEVMILTDY